jgi:hypothetical protein
MLDTRQRVRERESERERVRDVDERISKCDIVLDR